MPIEVGTRVKCIGTGYWHKIRPKWLPTFFRRSSPSVAPRRAS